LITVVLADDHAPTRDEIGDVLARDERFEVTAATADAPGAIDAALRTHPDICLLDVRMPGGGIAAAWEISGRLPDTTVVMLTVSDRDAHLFAALRAGARGYLLKDMDTDRLPQALIDAIEGRAPIPGKLVARIIDTFRDRSPRWRSVASSEMQAPLTAREWEVLEQVRKGRTTAEIADDLSVSTVTVRSHVSSALRKLRVSSRDEALALFKET
jgi:DNA-binding NarL/FixJ family response regulator